MPKLGVHLAKKLFFTAERFNGKQAVEYGLAHNAVPSDQLRTKTMEYIEQILKAGPNALMNCKQLTREVPTWEFEVKRCSNLQKQRKESTLSKKNDVPFGTQNSQDYC